VSVAHEWITPRGPELLLEFGTVLFGRIVRAFRILLGVQVIEIAEELVEAVGGRQELVQITEVVLPELPCRIAERLERLRDGRVFSLQADRRGRHADLRQAGAIDALSRNERRPARRTTLLTVRVREAHPFLRQAVDVGRSVIHQAAAVAAEIRNTDVIPPDDENIGLIGLWHLRLLRCSLPRHHQMKPLLRADQVFEVASAAIQTLLITSTRAPARVRLTQERYSADSMPARITYEKTAALARRCSGKFAWAIASATAGIDGQGRGLESQYDCADLADVSPAASSRRVVQALARSATRRQDPRCRRPVFGQPERRTHNYIRNGTLDLFAALNVATGEVLARCKDQHRAQDFVAFLREIEASVAPTVDIHVVLDNLSAHKAPPVQRWLVRHPRVQFHFTPTYASWLNLVERFFGLLTEKALKRGSHTSIAQLRAAILAYVDAHNDRDTPFKWVKTADEILDSMRRFGLRVQQVHGQ
jgi:transposase